MVAQKGLMHSWCACLLSVSIADLHIP